MDRNEFLIAASLALFLAFCLGWFVSWLLQWLKRGSADDPVAMQQITAALSKAELERDQTKLIQKEREDSLLAELNEVSERYRTAIDDLRDTQHELHSLRARVGP